MKKLFFVFLILLSILTLPGSVMAQKIAGESASINIVGTTTSQSAVVLKKKMVISKMLKKYNSPLLASVDSFISTCVEHNLDCYLLPSITGLESSFGQFTYPGSNNPFGWGGGLIMFQSWDKAIETVGAGLRENYINKGADTVEKIAPIYAASTTWAPRVTYFITQFEKEEEKIDAIMGQNQVQLL